MVTLCQVCEEARARYSCPKCGRRVCISHYNISLGVCSVCSEALCSFCKANLAISRCMLCGKLGCNECLIQVDNVRRVCIQCIDKYRKMNIITHIRFMNPIRLTRLIIKSPEPTDNT